MRYRYLSVFLCLALMSGCDMGIDGNPVATRATTEGIALQNLSNKTIYYIAFERGELAALNWRACNDPDNCVHLKPGNTALISYESIYGYKPGKAVVVFWWNLEKTPESNSYKVVNMTNTVVQP